MLFMNEYEIREAEERYRHHATLGPATRILRRYMESVNACSDGWPYWHAPVRAAAKLMALIQSGDATKDDVKRALTPMRSFMTRKGKAAGMECVL